MTILISTSQVEKIEIIIDIEVGKELFLVRISEIACSAAKLSVDPKEVKRKATMEMLISSSESSSSDSGLKDDHEINVGAKSTGVEQVVEEVEMVSPMEGNVGPVASWAETINKLNDLSHTQEQGNDSMSHSEDNEKLFHGPGPPARNLWGNDEVDPLLKVNLAGKDWIGGLPGKSRYAKLSILRSMEVAEGPLKGDRVGGNC
ncbi:hypothetical protein V6N13_134270 [Hibiscus sabdariffa]